MKKKYKGLSYIFSFFYFALLFYIVFLARRRHGIHVRILNLIPFRNKWEFLSVHAAQMNSYDRYQYAADILGNIILFIPFPICLYVVFKITNQKRIFSIALLSSFLIEFTQFVLEIGVADIDDVIWNIAGAMLGILFLKLVLIYVPAKSK